MFIYEHKQTHEHKLKLITKNEICKNFIVILPNNKINCKETGRQTNYETIQILFFSFFSFVFSTLFFLFSFCFDPKFKRDKDNPETERPEMREMTITLHSWVIDFAIFSFFFSLSREILHNFQILNWIKPYYHLFVSFFNVFGIRVIRYIVTCWIHSLYFSLGLKKGTEVNTSVLNVKEQ